jgi:hypothetical protein
LEVKVVGSIALNVLLSEVGLKVPENVGVGGPTQQFCYQSLEAADWAPMTGETMAP